MNNDHAMSLKELSAEDVVSICNILTLAPSLESRKAINTFLHCVDQCRNLEQIKLKQRQGMNDFWNTNDSIFFSQVLNSSLKSIQESRAHPKTFAYIFESLSTLDQMNRHLDDPSKFYKKEAFDFLSSLINTPDALNCVFLSFQDNKKVLTEILNYFSDIGDSDDFDKVFEVFSKNDYFNLVLLQRIAAQSNAKLLYHLFSSLEKNEKWKEEVRLSNLINELQLENPKNLEQALCTFLSKHFNNEKHTYIDLLNMESETLLKSPILKTMLIFPELAKKVFAENFGNILRKVFDAPNAENRSKYEALQCITANRLTGIEIDDQELCLYINNEKITLDRSNEAYAFVKGAIQLLPKEQKLSLLDQAMSRVSDPYIDLQVDGIWISLDFLTITFLYALNNDRVLNNYAFKKFDDFPFQEKFGIFNYALKNFSNFSDVENRSKYKDLQCITANRLTGIEINNQNLCLYINNEKINYLDKSNEAYAFVKGAIQLLPKEQKLSLLEQSISRISDPYIDFELEQYLDITGLSYDYILYALNNDKVLNNYAFKKFDDVPFQKKSRIFTEVLKNLSNFSDAENRSKYENLQCVVANRLTGIEINNQNLCLYINNEKINLDKSNEAYSFVKGAIQLLPKEKKLSLLEHDVLKISEIRTLEQYLGLIGLSYKEISENLQTIIKNKGDQNSELFKKFEDLKKDRGSKERKEALAFFEKASNTVEQSQSLLFCLRNFSPEDYPQNVEDLKISKFKTIIDALKEQQKIRLMQIEKANRNLNTFFNDMLQKEKSLQREGSQPEKLIQGKRTKNKNFIPYIEKCIKKTFDFPDSWFIPTHHAYINMIINSIIYDQSDKDKECNELQNLVIKINDEKNKVLDIVVQEQNPEDETVYDALIEQVEKGHENYGPLHKALEKFMISYKNLNDPGNRSEAVTGLFDLSQRIFDFLKADTEEKDKTSNKFFKYLENRIEDPEKNIKYNPEKCKLGEKLFISKLGKENYEILLGEFNYAEKIKLAERNLPRQNARQFVVKNLSEILKGISEENDHKNNQSATDRIQYFKIASFDAMKKYLKNFSEEYAKVQDLSKAKECLDELTEVFMDIYDGKSVAKPKYIDPSHYSILKRKLKNVFLENEKEYIEKEMKNDLIAFGPYARLVHLLEGAVDEGAKGEKRCAIGLISDTIKTLSEIYGCALDENNYSAETFKLAGCARPENHEDAVMAKN
ncbi:hypothetical protein [Holospora elegans]|nr:hypothetical protein [Holospora elegans]